MKRILYIFPHPDDESFGPAPAIAAQRRAGHQVYLLTLTKGEATKQRFRLGVEKEEMGEIRYREMQCVEKVLGLSGMTVLDFPDGRLKELDPIELEKRIEEEIRRIEPDVVITYAVHGVSGFEDHLVSHAVVKRAWCAMKRRGEAPARLAFYTHRGEVNRDGKFTLQTSSDEEIDCITRCSEEDMEAFHKALDCYETYEEVIEQSGVRKVVTGEVPFEFFQEVLDEFASDVTEGL